MTVRSLNRSEAAAAGSLWARSADALTRDALAALLWGDGGRPVAVDLGGTLAGLASGAPWTVPGAVRGTVRAVVVAPEARRRGVGTALLAAVEAGLRGQGATEARLLEGAPVYLSPGIDTGDTRALAFAAAAGYTAFGESVDLDADLAQPLDTADDETRLAASDVSVRRATEADRAALGILLDAHWPAWQGEVDGALGQSRPPLHLALRDGAVLGFAAHSVTPLAVARFGPMGTAPAARGLGIGAVLLRRCLADLRDDGHARAVIGWAAALPFYESAVGATVARRFQRFAKPL